MRASPTLPELQNLILTREHLVSLGWTSGRIQRAVAQARIIRLARARYAAEHPWCDLRAEDRLVMRVLATAHSQHIEAVYCRESAAALLGLPLYRCAGERSQLYLPGRRSATNSVYVTRHAGGVEPRDIVRTAGVRCTGLDRTLMDIARFSPRDRALACLDAAIRRQFPVPQGDPDSPEARAWIAALGERLSSMRGARGVRAGASLLRMADGAAESPLESVARLRFVELGFRVATQVRVASPSGGFYYVDLELIDRGVLCEVDGKSKYVDERLRAGRSVEEVVYREKRREEWIRSREGKPLIRLADEDIRTARSLADRLTRLNIPVPIPPPDTPPRSRARGTPR